jgi:hypothetical protein
MKKFKLLVDHVTVETFHVQGVDAEAKPVEYLSTMCTACTNDLTNCICACGGTS